MEGPGVWRVPPAERTEGAPTPGMTRGQAIATDGIWAGIVHTDAGMLSGWHHHGEYETSIYVISGALRMEFGRRVRRRSRLLLATSCMWLPTRSIGKATLRPSREQRWWSGQAVVSR